MADYLHMLPVELWREILFFAYPPTPDETVSNDPIDFFDYLSTTNGMQPKYLYTKLRAQLRRVCKFLEPIARELLFVNVDLTTANAGEELFLETIETLGETGNEVGSSVRRFRLHIASRAVMEEDGSGRSSSMRDNIKALCAYCPNLRTVELDTRDASEHPIGGVITALHGLQSLIWRDCSISSHGMQTLSAQNPHLSTLVLLGPFDYFLPLVELPQLRRLHIETPSTITWLPTISAPNLEWIRLGMFITPSVITFLQRSAQHATFLHLGYKNRMRDIIGAVYACPRLETLGVDRKFASAEDIPVREPHPTLNRLILYCVNVLTVAPILHQWGFQPAAPHSSPLGPCFTGVVIRKMQRNYDSEEKYERTRVKFLGVVAKKCDKRDALFTFR